MLTGSSSNIYRAEFREAGHWEVEFSVLPFILERIPDLVSISRLLAECQVTLRGWSFPFLDRQHASNFAGGVQSYTITQHLPRKYVEGYRAYQSGLFV
jgi:hypothetical protein